MSMVQRTTQALNMQVHNCSRRRLAGKMTVTAKEGKANPEGPILYTIFILYLLDY